MLQIAGQFVPISLISVSGYQGASAELNVAGRRVSLGIVAKWKTLLLEAWVYGLTRFRLGLKVMPRLGGEQPTVLQISGHYRVRSCSSSRSPRSIIVTPLNWGGNSPVMASPVTRLQRSAFINSEHSCA
jgi:hypothetical protein